jgi:hypothetical protein
VPYVYVPLIEVLKFNDGWGSFQCPANECFLIVINAFEDQGITLPMNLFLVIEFVKFSSSFEGFLFEHRSEYRGVDLRLFSFHVSEFLIIKYNQRLSENRIAFVIYLLGGNSGSSYIFAKIQRYEP